MKWNFGCNLPRLATPPPTHTHTHTSFKAIRKVVPIFLWQVTSSIYCKKCHSQSFLDTIGTQVEALLCVLLQHKAHNLKMTNINFQTKATQVPRFKNYRCNLRTLSALYKQSLICFKYWFPFPRWVYSALYKINNTVMPILLAETIECVHIEQVSALFTFRLGQVLLYIKVRVFSVDATLISLVFLHLFYCATCFGPRTIFRRTHCP
jgi:hypothetical protein